MNVVFANRPRNRIGSASGCNAGSRWNALGPKRPIIIEKIARVRVSPIAVDRDVSTDLDINRCFLAGGDRTERITRIIASLTYKGRKP